MTTLAFYLGYSATGLVVGLCTLKHRSRFGGDGSENEIVWVLMATQMWPLLLLFPAAIRVERWYWRTKQQLRSRPPKWHDRLYFWLFF